MRKELPFDENWLFVRSENIPLSDFPVQTDHITVPHTWNGSDGQDGGGDYCRATCTYRKRFLMKEVRGDRDYLLEFGAAAATARVWLNGIYLARHDGGYSRFRVRVTDAIREGENDLIVACDNSRNDRVYPQNADFTFYGGIYRKVRLLEVSRDRFDMETCGGDGIRVTSAVNGDGSADVRVETWITGHGEVRVTLGRETKSGTDVSFRLPSPHLWNGRKDPFLYTVKAVLVNDRQVSDEVSVRFGIRTFSVDPNEGFFLNGAPYPLRGAAKHQDRPGKGSAVSREDLKEDIDLILEAGFTTVRLAHYQHDQYTYDLCDETGLIVWAEIPYISEHLDGAEDNARSQMKELITQCGNHPSIVCWGLSNEITMARGDNPRILPFHRELNGLCHRMDPQRLTAMACLSSLPTDSPLLEIPDVLAYNHYFGWYGGRTDEYGTWFDAFHEQHPDRAVGVSEYGCENALWHASHPEPGDYSEEYQMQYHEALIRELFPRKYLWATYVWNMFDFAADARDEGGTHGRNNKGLVTFDRKYRKDAFYAYKAWLNPEPMLHLCGKSFVRRDGDEARFTVYSNLPSVTMYVDGKPAGTQTCPDHFFHFTVKQPEGGYTVRVCAGNLSESAHFKKIAAPDPSYSFGGGTVLNWFDIESPEGYCSLRDLVRDLETIPAAEAVIRPLIALLIEKREEARRAKERESGGKIAVSGEGMTPEQHAGTMRQFSVLQLIRMGWPDMPKERILEVNRRLNEIPKP